MTFLNPVWEYLPDTLASWCRPWLFVVLALTPYASAQAYPYSLDELLAFPLSYLLQLEFSPSPVKDDHVASAPSARSGKPRVVSIVLKQETVPGKTLLMASGTRFPTYPLGSAGSLETMCYLRSCSRRLA
jgi:hypothetical protein